MVGWLVGEGKKVNACVHEKKEFMHTHRQPEECVDVAMQSIKQAQIMCTQSPHFILVLMVAKNVLYAVSAPFAPAVIVQPHKHGHQ